MPRKKISEGGSMPIPAWKPGQLVPGGGRPSTFTDELGQKIVNLLWSGECRSLCAIGELPHMPTRQTINNWKKVHPEFAAALEEAQEAIGEVYAHDNDGIVADVLAGRVEPAAASVAIKSNQWKAMVTNPKTFATKTHTQKDETKKITVEYIDRIPIEGLDEEQLDAIEEAFQKMLPRPDGGSSTTQ